MTTAFKTAVVAAMLPLLWACSSDSGSDPEPPPPPPPPQSQAPNILFVVLDDVGVDQLAFMGYGGITPPQLPTMQAIASAGVNFRNAWSMPTCSPTRATFFTGRYPSRMEVYNAIQSPDLANSQVSPYELTVPRVLKDHGYVSALIGKMHLSGSDLNRNNLPLGDGVMQALGWDYFEGYLDGAPYPIDTEAGGVARDGAEYFCGFVPNASTDPTHGADSGACYQPDGNCTMMSTLTAATPGRACMEQGGIFDPNRACQAELPEYVDFTRQNGYYTGKWVINQPDGTVQTLSPAVASHRGYRSTVETDRALAWIRQQPADQPWMLSLGYSAVHAPLQPPPTTLLPQHSVDTSGFNCTDAAQQRVLANQVLEAVDAELGRLMVETGLAQRRPDGSLDYRPHETNTMIVIMGDNGTYAPTVKAPFNPTRSKGWVYQPGVWVPLLVAGPLVNDAGRDVPHMVNGVDLYRLFAEIAGIDLEQLLPSNRVVDAEPMLPYLVEPDHASIRSVNFTEVGQNLQVAGTEPSPPCVIPSVNACVQILSVQAVCEDQSGIWYGPGGAAGPEGLSNCCQVNEWLAAQGEAEVDIFPDIQRAIRNSDFKLVQFERMSCATGQIETGEEFYRINEGVPVPKLDNAEDNLLAQGTLPPSEYSAYMSLREELANIEARNIRCPGDGNLDLKVNQEDLEGWEYFSRLNGGHSSWYDFNLDGLVKRN